MRRPPLPQRHTLLAKVSGFVVLVVSLLLLSVVHANAAPSTAAPASPDAGNIGNFIWREPRYTFNGIQNAGEPGIPFAPVNLYNATGTTLLSVTNASAVGIYNLNIPTNGSYYLEFPNPSNTVGNPTLAGFQRSPANQGGNDALDSDADVTDGWVGINVTGNDSSVDAGYYDRSTSQTYCTGRQLSFTDWSGTFTLPQSNPAMGTLTGVYFRAAVGSAQDATVTNTGAGTQNFSYEGGALVQLTMPYGIPQLNVSTGRLVTGIVLGPGASTSFTDLVDYRFVDYTVPTPVRPNFIGTGTFAVGGVAQGRSAFTGGGNLQAVATTEAYTSLCVTYLYEAPLAVTLNSFDAQCRATNNDIQVAWETASEVNTLGFNVLRGTDANTPGTRVNSDLIPAQATGGSGAAYDWADNSVSESGTYYYWLESVDTDGITATHGPVSAAYPCAPTAVTLDTLTAQSTPVSVPPMIAALVGAGVVVLAGAAATWRKR